MRSKSGFTLLEMSVVLVILSVVAAGAMTALNAQTRNNQAAITSGRLDAIEAAIGNMVAVSGYEPCAASALVSLDDANTTDDTAYGVPTSCAQAATIPGTHIEDSGTYDIRPAGGASSGADDIRFGSVPVRALGLPDSYMFDGWGNRFTYATIKSMSRDKATAAAYVPSGGLTTGVIKVTDSAGNQIPNAVASMIVPYAVISHGPLGHGAIPHLGGAFAACPATWMESKNCDLDEVFVDTRYNDSATSSAGYYTNLIRWKPKTNLVQPAAAATPAVSTSVALAVYEDFYLDKFGKLWVAGKNQYGDFGNNTTTGSATLVRGAPAIPAFQSVSTTAYGDACGLDSSSHLYCWGYNADGELGTGNTTNYSIPQAVTPSMTWQQVTTGYSNACAIAGNGALYCWGANGEYQLANNTTTSSYTPLQIGTDTAWTSVSIAYGVGQYICGVDNGLAYCWGSGSAYTTGAWLGQGTSPPAYVKTPTLVSGGITNWKMVDSGYGTTCGITQTSALYCWGGNGVGQVGDGTTTDRYTPTAISSGWSAVSLDKDSYGTTCGIKTNGTLWCWGNNGYGQLGTADTTSRSTPTQIGSATDWLSVKTEHTHSCGVRNGGRSLYCWGKNTSNQFGNGTTDTGSTTPELIPTNFSF